MKIKMGTDQPYRGHLGRTAQTSVLISSTEGPVFPASVYTCVNVTQTPELQQALLDGTLNHVPCPFSDHTYKLAMPVVYHDEERSLFVLILPEELRHEEFKHRSALLDALAKEREILPAYVRAFHTVFSPQAIENLESPRESEVPESAQPHEDQDEALQNANQAARDLLEQERIQLEQQQQQLAQEQQQLEDARKELESARQQLEDARKELESSQQHFSTTNQTLEADRAALQELRAQFENEQLDLQRVREELEEQRRVLLVESLNLEQARLNALENSPAVPDERTQVVTDDQFIEVFGESADDASPNNVAYAFDEDEGKEIIEIDADSEGYEIEEILEPAGAPYDSAANAEATQIIESPLNSTSLSILEFPLDTLPESFENAFSSDADSDNNLDYGLILYQDYTLAGWRLLEEEIQPYVTALHEQSLRFFFQYREINNLPLLSLMLARVDANEQALESIALPIPLLGDSATDTKSQQILTQLANDERLRIALYNAAGEPHIAFDIIAPIAANIAWARSRASQLLAENPADPAAFQEITKTYLADDFERLGTMRHTFEKGSFAHAMRPSQAKLAAGVVGYWSLDDVFDYLIGIRSFPLRDFRAIQRRAIEQSIEWGIYINQPLQQLAISEGFAPDLRTLTERIIANFAEVSVGIRANDLDPIQHWENWDILLELAADVDIVPDPSVIELAEISLKRAQEYQDMLDAGNSLQGDYEEADEILEEDEDHLLAGDEFQEMLDAVHFDDLVVARHSEQTGITYFLPESALIDSFDDMASMSQEDLELLLEDGSGRLEASQMLIERFGKDALPAVLAAVENMNATEVAALARFTESRADDLIPDLIAGLDTCGPSTLYITARALVARRTNNPQVNEAIPTLLAATLDPARAANQQALLQTIAQFGDQLVAPLMRAIKQNVGDKALIALLSLLENERPGTIAEFARDRSKPLRDAAASARNRMESIQN